MGARLLRRFVALTAALSRAAGIAAAICLLLAVVVVCQMVFVRYVLGHSTIWQTEFTTFTLVAAVFLGSPYVLLVRGHVSVELLPLYLGPRARRVLAVIAALLTLAFCLIMAIKCVQLWHEAFRAGWTTDSVWGVALWKPYLAMAVGMVLLALQALAGLLAPDEADRAGSLREPDG